MCSPPPRAAAAIAAARPPPPPPPPLSVGLRSTESGWDGAELRQLSAGRGLRATLQTQSRGHGERCSRGGSEPPEDSEDFKRHQHRAVPKSRELQLFDRQLSAVWAGRFGWGRSGPVTTCECCHYCLGRLTSHRARMPWRPDETGADWQCGRQCRSGAPRNSQRVCRPIAWRRRRNAGNIMQRSRRCEGCGVR